MSILGKEIMYCPSYKNFELWPPLSILMLFCNISKCCEMIALPVGATALSVS